MWTKEQSEAINKSGTNIIVSAGAGSGKTAVLSERVIKKLENGININELLILTFTKAAAGEMRERIRKKIKKNESLKEQLSLIDSAYITTFDSYALSLVKKYHYILSVNKDISITSESIINLEKEKQIDNIFEDYYKNKNDKFIKLINTFCIKDDNEIRKYILDLSSKIDMIIDKDSFLDTYIEKNFNTTKIKEDIKMYESLIFDKITKLRNYIEEIRFFVTSDYYEKLLSSCMNILEPICYDDIVKNLNVRLPQLRGAEDGAKEIKEKISNVLKEIKDLCSYSSTRGIENGILLTKDYVQIIIDILKCLDKKIYEYKNKYNIYEFNDIEMMAIKLLKENNNIKEEVKNSFHEILLDEYQDTNDIQEEFINLIANNNVYMVGDIKQSIYRFRNANPSIFKDKYDKYKDNDGGIKIDLNKNFRSREEVINNINTIFNKVMNMTYGGADYISSHQMVFGNTNYIDKGLTRENYNMEFYTYNYDKDNTLTKDEIEAFIIASDIRNKIDNHYQIYDKDSDMVRTINYSDIVILLDRSSNFDLYKKIFTYHNIPLMVLKDEKMMMDTDIIVIKNILSFILKISKRVFDKEFEYLFTSISRSFLFKTSDGEIYDSIINKKIKETLLYKKCQELSKNINSISIYKLLENVLEEFDYYNKLITIGNIDSSIVKIDKLFDIIESTSLLGFTLEDFINYLNDCIDSGYDITYSAKNNSNCAVNIMTIHKSKGLEFHLCYFANLYKKFNILEIKEKFIFDKKYGFVVPYFDEGIANTIYKELVKYDYINEEISEKIRLFYVALTRAKEKMIFVMPYLECSNIDECDYRSFIDIIKSLDNVLTPFKKNISLDLINLTKDYENIKNINLDSLLKSNVPSLDVCEANIDYKPMRDDKFSKSILKPNTLEEFKNIEYGKRMHYLLECDDFYNPVYDITKNLLNHDIFNNINSAKIYKEYEFIYEEDNTSYHGIIDLMLIYDDYVDIIDYKLSNISDNNYLKQLEGYKNYIMKKTLKSVNIYLYSILKNELHKL